MHNTINYIPLFFRFLKENNLYCRYKKNIQYRMSSTVSLNNQQKALKNLTCHDKHIAYGFIMGTFYWGDDRQINWYAINDKWNVFLSKII